MVPFSSIRDAWMEAYREMPLAVAAGAPPCWRAGCNGLWAPPLALRLSIERSHEQSPLFCVLSLVLRLHLRGSALRLAADAQTEQAEGHQRN
jgi:hypothetical protein